MEARASVAAMMVHRVAAGECMNSIAERYGFFWETLWNLPENAALREARRNPNILAEGDRVFVPEVRLHQQPAATGRRHSFRRRGVPAWLRFRFLDAAGVPRTGLAFTLEVDGKRIEGATDGRGAIAVPIPPSARTARLVLEGGERYVFQLGGLDPVDTPRGARGRLRSLGFFTGPVDGPLDGPVEAALRQFQHVEGLEMTGQPDEATRGALVRRHGS
jgi:hypothetical protein